MIAHVSNDPRSHQAAASTEEPDSVEPNGANSCQAVAPGVQHHWFVTCAFTTTTQIDGEPFKWPATTAHAKAMGGISAACGRRVDSWPRLFHLGFPVLGIDNCGECLVVVAKGTP